MIEKSSLNTISWLESSKCHVMWRHSISTWRHEVKELTIHILASRCDRKIILFLILWYFESPSSNMLLIFHLYDAVTSWRHVMTSQNLIYLSQLEDVLESWFFFLFLWFFRSLSSNTLLISHLCDAVTSWRHVMTSLNLIYLSQLEDVLESWFFFLFLWFFRSLSSNTLLISHLCDAVTSWRHVMTSLNLIHLSQLVDELESCFFFVSMVLKVTEFKNIDDFSFVWCHDVMTSWHHAMTSQKLFNLSQVMNSLEKWSCSGFHGFSGCLFSKC